MSREPTEVLTITPGDPDAKMVCGCVIERNPDTPMEVRARMCMMHLNAPETTHRLRDMLQLAVVMATAQVAKKNDDALITRESFVMKMREKGANDDVIKNIIKGRVNWMSLWQSLIKTLAKADPDSANMVDDASKAVVEMYMASIEDETGEIIDPALKAEAMRDGPAEVRKEVLKETEEDKESCDCNMCRMLLGKDEE